MVDSQHLIVIGSVRTAAAEGDEGNNWAETKQMMDQRRRKQ